MEQIKDFIKRLWQGETTSRENKQYSRLFRQQEPQWKALMKEEYKADVRNGVSLLSPDESEQVLQRLHHQIAIAATKQQQRGRLASFTAPWTRWVAAAVVLLVAGAAWRYYYPAAKNTTLAQRSISPANEVIVQTNDSKAVSSIELSDHSTVRLDPGSSISYYRSFDTGRRDISLSGKATFDVARNSSRPFTVYAGDISTTVLGTRFMMSTLTSGKVQVKLFEGRVVVRSTAKTFAMNEVYLHPGQQFEIDKQLRQFAVTLFKDNTSTPGTAITAPGRNVDITAVEFSQEPLANVLARIGKRYNVRFRLSGEGFDNMLITGKFLPSDSLQVVLSMLGNINGLSFRENSGTIEVARLP